MQHLAFTMDVELLGMLVQITATTLSIIGLTFSQQSFGVISTAFITVAVHYGLGLHMIDLVEQGTPSEALKHQWMSTIFALVSIGLGKIAVVAFLIDVQGKTHKYQRLFLKFLAATNLLFNLILICVILTQCDPPRALWDRRMEERSCPRIKAHFAWSTFAGAWNAATDAILAVYPVSIVHNLRIAVRLKVGLCFLLGLGWFTAVCSALKTYEVKAVENTEDPTWYLAALLLWGLAEMWVILIASSVPPLWPLMKLCIERFPSNRKGKKPRLSLGPLYHQNHAKELNGLRRLSVNSKQGNMPASPKSAKLKMEETAASLSPRLQQTQSFGRARSINRNDAFVQLDGESGSVRGGLDEKHGCVNQQHETKSGEEKIGESSPSTARRSVKWYIERPHPRDTCDNDSLPTEGV